MPNVTPIDSAETYTIAYVNDALIAVVPDGDTDALDDAIKLHIDMCMARDMDPEEPIIHRDLTLYEITYDAEEDGAAIMWSDRDTVAALPPSAA
ncbi:hypothetical protein SAMN04489859_106510 [Paracoccus alcaliphilus]|uniref:Uncharacterized protein n=1 Tax=Paracoccus alcaliphilus TaxID=34002 RepID=A0A1H8NMK8_9RHOB|nr:hypothetical protein [Paracoccus alcaliphilus]WCR17486.1 hypothetical protein JHW40_14280 [Paracoccus alcaliphilus]SEO30850.1 hypothetical protein SAMN04489859_106510 [Paracoccus alcaliphilus]